MARICKLLMGLPSSGKRYAAQTREWASIYGIPSGDIKIANNDLDYDFSQYNEQNKQLVIIWNPAWIYDSDGLDAMITDATNNGYTIDKEHFANDTVQTKCNAYVRYGGKRNLNSNFAYYEFLSKFIDNYSAVYDKYLTRLVEFNEGLIAIPTAVEILDKESCKGDGEFGGELPNPELPKPCEIWIACDG